MANFSRSGHSEKRSTYCKVRLRHLHTKAKTECGNCVFVVISKSVGNYFPQVCVPTKKMICFEVCLAIALICCFPFMDECACVKVNLGKRGSATLAALSVCDFAYTFVW